MNQIQTQQDSSIELSSTEKSCAFPFKDTSTHLVAINPLEIFPKKNCAGKLTFLLFALNFQISFPLTNK